MTIQYVSSVSATVGFEITSRAATLFFNLVLAKFLGADNYGQYVLFVTVSVWAWSVFDLGLTTDGLRRVSSGSDVSVELQRIVGTRACILTPVLLFTPLLILMIDDAVTMSLWWSVWSIILYIFGMNIFVTWIFRGLQRHSDYSISHFFTAIFTALAFISVSILDIDTFAGAMLLRGSIWLLAGTCSITLLLRIYPLAKPINFLERYRDYFSRLKRSYKLGACAMLNLAFPVMLLGRAASLNGEGLGYFALLWQLFTVGQALSGINSSIFMPLYIKTLETSVAQITALLLSYIFITAAFATLVGGIFYFAAPVAATLIMDGDHYPSHMVTAILAAVTPLAAVRLLLDRVLIAHGAYGRLLCGYIAGATTLILLGFASHTLVGLTVGYAMTECVLICSALFQLKSSRANLRVS